MKRTDKGAGKDSWKARGSWGVQVLLILAVGMLVAMLGWFTGQRVDPTFDRPDRAVTVEAGSS